MRAFLFSLILFSSVLCTFGHVILDLKSITKQIRARDLMSDLIFDQLTTSELRFIDENLRELSAYNLTECEKCKNNIKFASSLLRQYPDKKHLVGLILYKYCIEQNEGDFGACLNIDFFISSGTNGKANISVPAAGATLSTPYLSYFDNDFLEVLTRFNTSNEVELDIYCYHKHSTCELPNIDDFVNNTDIETKWPPKEPKHYSEPVYLSSNRSTFNVLHLSDTHVQLRYEIGSESNCSSYICCLPESFNTKLLKNDYNFSDTYYEFNNNLPTDSPIEYSFYPNAHYEGDVYVKGDYYDFPKNEGFNSVHLPTTTFGGYKCDVPVVLLNNTLRYIRKSEMFDSFEFTIFTGDLVDHDGIHDTPQLTMEQEFKTFAIMKSYLGNKTVYPVLGNHDAFPYAQMAPIKYDYNNFYNWNEDLMQQLWTENGWVPQNWTSEIKQHYAGYSVETKRGLKVISLNSNTYYKSNLWAYINSLTDWDMFGQWQFLIDELVESEAKDQRVWILAHVPLSGDNAIYTQTRIFHKIIERFSPYTIANIFFGHTHRDQFHVMYKAGSAKEAEDIINMYWVSQSVTPIQYNNPSWRYYEVEDESFNIRNSFNYYTQLNDTFTNGGAEPEWKMEYSARETYDPTGEWPLDAPLNASFWHQFVSSKLRNTSDIATNQAYIDLQYRYTPYSPDCRNGTEVSVKCWNNNWCDVSSFDTLDLNECLR